MKDEKVLNEKELEQVSGGAGAQDWAGANSPEKQGLPDAPGGYRLQEDVQLHTNLPDLGIGPEGYDCSGIVS